MMLGSNVDRNLFGSHVDQNDGFYNVRSSRKDCCGRPTSSNIFGVLTCLGTGQKTQGVVKECSMVSIDGYSGYNVDPDRNSDVCVCAD